jgi:hypothetical protein
MVPQWAVMNQCKIKALPGKKDNVRIVTLTGKTSNCIKIYRGKWTGPIRLTTTRTQMFKTHIQTENQVERKKSGSALVRGDRAGLKPNKIKETRTRDFSGSMLTYRSEVREAL